MEELVIDSNNHRLYKAFREIYDQSFPLFEQRTESQQTKAFSSPHYRLKGYEEGEFLLGFISYWEFDRYIYIEHFAIHPAFRGKGLGQCILQKFIASVSRFVILEIDPIVDKVSEARLHFYQHCSFKENPYAHIHPPYRDGYTGHSLIVLSMPSELPVEIYEQFCMDLSKTIMNFA